MSFIFDFEKAITYIEENLDSEIDITKASQKANCSSYHFLRVFSTLAGIPLSEYIRRRRITLAAFEIQNTSKKIIDIALKYGYESHSSFTRAFQTIQGISPTKARMAGAILTSYPPLAFQIIIKGAEAMQYKIIDTESFQLFGTDEIQVDGWPTEKLLENGDRVIENGSHDAINIAAGFPGNALNMIEKDCWDVTKIHLLHAIYFWDKDGNKMMMYGWEVPTSGVDERFKILNVPKTKWAIVTIPLDGNRSVIKKCYEDMYINWFPSSGYEQTPGCPIIEKYDANNAELWMPILKK